MESGDRVARLNSSLRGRYVLERELGQGGMATVYLARDVRHERQVALKLLKPELAAIVGIDRFLSEIRTTANLQHPHILPLFDSGEVDGFLYFVMPLVEGESLRNRLDRERQLPVAEATRIALDAAEALDYAHRHGVIHRDIKPANIMLHDGRVLITDFGIALAVQQAGGTRLTETGLSLGTPSYMSPEQATGEHLIDGRSDLYSLGCVLYEMLAGQPPHVGPTAQAILVKILTDQPTPVSELRAAVPPHIEAVVHTALARLPADRFQTAQDFARALEGSAHPGPTWEHPAHRQERGGPKWRRIALGSALVGALALVMAGWGWFRTPAEPQRQVTRLVLDLPDAPRQDNWWGPSVVLSHDGATFAYIGRAEDAPRTTRSPSTRSGWRLRRLGQLDSEAFFSYAEYATFSPDGRAMAFRTGAYVGEIRVKTVAGDREQMLMDSAGAPGIAWGEDDWLYFSLRNQGLARMPSAGGSVERLTQLDVQADEVSHGWPHPLPNGRGVLFTVARQAMCAAENRDIAVLDLTTGTHRQIVRGIKAQYAASGHIVFARADGTLMGAPFDADRLSVVGPAAVLIRGISVNDCERGADFELSRSGDLLYVTEAPRVPDEVVLVGFDGSAETLEADWRGRLVHPAISPDGSQLAVTVFRHRNPPNVFVGDLSRGEVRRVSFGPVLDYYPQWIRDGSAMIFVGPRPPARTDWDLYVKHVDGSGADSLLLDAPGEVAEAVLSPDGAWVVYTEESGGQYDIHAAPFSSDRRRTVDIAASNFNERDPTVSPDGKWVAYVSDESGRPEVYVRPFPDAHVERWQISLEGGDEPAWAPDSRSLFFVNADARMVAANVAADPAFRVTAQQQLFSVAGYEFRDFDVMPDGRRFVMVRRGSDVAPGHLILVQNFVQELDRLAAR